MKGWLCVQDQNVIVGIHKYIYCPVCTFIGRESFTRTRNSPSFGPSSMRFTKTRVGGREVKTPFWYRVRTVWKIRVKLSMAIMIMTRTRGMCERDGE